MNKETELSDKAIKDMHQYHYGVERYLKFALAVIAADRELRRGDDQDLAQLHANGAKAWVDELRGNTAGTTERIRANHLQDDGGMISEAALSHAINQASCAIADGTEADRIRAIGKALWRQWQAQQSAQAQPVALPAGMPEPVAWIAEYGGDIYTAAQVQAMLAAHVPVAAFDRKPLADEQVNKYAKVGAIRTEPDGKVWRYAIQYKQELERRYVKGFRDAERAHGIKAQQGVSA